MTLLDTCVLIDVLRGRESAITFVATLSERPAISVLTATELVAGCRTDEERREIDRLLSTYEVLEVGLAVAVFAGEHLRRFARSHGVDPIDAVVAATAEMAKKSLATLNLKHFPMFADLKRPY